jgi:hypothetical protein
VRTAFGGANTGNPAGGGGSVVVVVDGTDATSRLTPQHAKEPVAVREDRRDRRVEIGSRRRDLERVGQGLADRIEHASDHRIVVVYFVRPCHEYDTGVIERGAGLAHPAAYRLVHHDGRPDRASFGRKAARNEIVALVNRPHRPKREQAAVGVDQ